VTTLAAGSFCSFAVTSDGTAWGWGYNVDGELGNGTTTNSNIPVEVSG
jgi:alpha-tubulin suppressor-like RCC1 family protein